MNSANIESELYLRQGFKPNNFKRSIVYLHDDAAPLLRPEDIHPTKIYSFTNAAECSHFIEIMVNGNLYLLVSKMVENEFIMNAGKLAKVLAIYLYGPHTQFIEDGLPKCRRVDTKEDLIETIQKRIKKDADIEQFEFNVFGVNVTSTCFDLHSESHFHMWFQLLLENLMHMNADEKHKCDFISYWQKFYEADPDERELVEEFRKNYTSENAVWWYTRHTFVFLQLNAALRQQNIDILFLFHFYLTDLYNQLKQLHQTFVADETRKKEQDGSRPILRVYRYQILSNHEMNKLENQAEPKYISSNIMFSTTRDYGLALEEFTGQPQKGLEYCLFEIEVDLKKEMTTVFADITHLSKYKNEREVLFMAGAVFQVEKMTPEMYGNIKVTHIRLVHCGAAVHSLHELTQSLKNRLEDGGHLLTLAHILKELGNYSKAGEFYQRLLDKTPDHSPIQKAACYTGLGNVAKAQGRYSHALSCYKEALERKIRVYRNESDPNLAVNFNNMGLVYRHLEKLDDAILFHERALEIREKLIEDVQNSCDTKENRRRHIDVADSHCNLATVYFEQNEENKMRLAWDHAKKSLSIHKQYMQPDDPKLAVNHRLIGLLYHMQNEYDKAKKAFQKALNIQKKALGDHNVETAATKCCLGNLILNEASLKMDKQEPYKEAMNTGCQLCQEGMDCFDRFGLPANHRYRTSAQQGIQKYKQIRNQAK